MEYNNAMSVNEVQQNKKSWYELSEEENLSKMVVPQFLTVKIEETGKNFNNVSPFEIHKWVSSLSKNIKDKKLQKPGSTVSTKILKQTLFNTTKISVTPHERLNTSKGVFYCRDLREISDENIIKELKAQNVISIKRLGKSSSLFIATFGTPNKPEKLLIGYLSVPVRTYVPPPLICCRCGLLGHHDTSCSKEPVCRKCSDTKHIGSCSRIKCCLCGGEHLTTVKTCETYAEEFQIKKTMVELNLSYNEAKKKGHLRPVTSYAQAVKASSINEMGVLTSMIENMNARMEALEKLISIQFSIIQGNATSQANCMGNSSGINSSLNSEKKTPNRPKSLNEAKMDDEITEEKGARRQAEEVLDSRSQEKSESTERSSEKSGRTWKRTPKNGSKKRRLNDTKENITQVVNLSRR